MRQAAAVRVVRAVVVTMASVAGLSTAVRADAIDGDWCHATSSLTISGPSIRTPAGTEMRGDYDRHGFAYVVPAHEPGAGAQVVMRLNNDEMMTLIRRAGGQDSAPEIWRRCKPIS
jgi:hypothetical protein